MMRFHALATDYDGTLAHHGRVAPEFVEALQTLLATGRRLVMVTGRELPELIEIFPDLGLFEWVVAENGGLLYRPATKEERPLAEPPPREFVDALVQKGVGPLSVGGVIVATWEPHELIVLETIREMGLDLQVIFNKGAVMVLPAGVNKASGLSAALQEMGLSPHNVVGVGDAENDHAFLKLCELSAAVANALPAVKDTADVVLPSDHGEGVRQLIDMLMEDDLHSVAERVVRHRLSLGRSGEKEVALPAHGRGILICGPSSSGKSTVATRIVESILEGGLQFCLIDPEGDYEDFEGAVVCGGPKSAPPREEVLRLLRDPAENAIVCLTGMPIADRPPAFLSLLAQLLELRTQTGRPHWLILDEAHHLLPAEWRPPEGLLPDELTNVLLITVHPEMLSPDLLQRVDTVLAVGKSAATTLRAAAKAMGAPTPAAPAEPPAAGEVLLWACREEAAPRVVRVDPCKTERRRHSRKYAEGELPPDRSFYFRGPHNRLNLRAQNLMLFLQLAEGVDDATWMHHLQAGDYSRWFRDAIKDDDLAVAARLVEINGTYTPDDSRRRIREAIEATYTLPARGSLPVPGAS